MKLTKLPITSSKTNSIPIWFVEHKGLAKLGKKLPPAASEWATTNGFTGKAGEICVLPDLISKKPAGKISAILFGYEKNSNPLDTGSLAKNLPQGTYHFAVIPNEPHLACLGFILGSYKFDRYKKLPSPNVLLVLPKGVDKSELTSQAQASMLVRDLINTPTNDMGPDDLEKSTRAIASKFKAKLSIIKGSNLLKKNFPMIHAVGRASEQAPRLLDLKWGKASHPKVTLVGKGVCFDTGGLNIKPGNSMALMKKDMGGAANVLGLAYMIMASKLPVRLRVLIPAVENSISANAFRPGDVLKSRMNLTVEIGNTDAEGRLVLGDALAYSDEEKPDLMIDMATLTGAARVALGPDLPPFYTDDYKLASSLSREAELQCDPLWQMPLWKPYQAMLASKVADCNHITSGGYAGSVTAALFLQKFVNPKTTWMHLDVFGWAPSAKPWVSVGGEAQGIRALYSVIKKRYT